MLSLGTLSVCSRIVNRSEKPLVAWRQPGWAASRIHFQVCFYSLLWRFFSLSCSAILGSDSIQGNTSIISGSGPQIVLWLRLWKLLLSKLLADLPVLLWAGLKRAWWDIESLTKHKSGGNNRSFAVGFWLSAFKRFLSKQPSCSLSASCQTQTLPSLRLRCGRKGQSFGQSPTLPWLGFLLATGQHQPGAEGFYLLGHEAPTTPAHGAAPVNLLLVSLPPTGDESQKKKECNLCGSAFASAYPLPWAQSAFGTHQAWELPDIWKSLAVMQLPKYSFLAC